MGKLKEGIDYYYNKEGKMVLTEMYHMKRGYCCGNHCLHCVYTPKGLKYNRKLRTEIFNEDKS